MFESEFLDLMTQTAQYLPATGADNYGQTRVGTAVTVPCHTTYKTVINYGNEEENQTSNANLQMPPPGFMWTMLNGAVVTMPTVDTQDQFTLLDGTTRHVLWVSTYFDGGPAGGPHHQSVYLD